MGLMSDEVREFCIIGVAVGIVAGGGVQTVAWVARRWWESRQERRRAKMRAEARQNSPLHYPYGT